MTTATKTRRRVKPVRTIKLALKPFEGNPGVVSITVGKDAADYFLSTVAADFGTGFRLEKIGGGETYHVNLAADPKNHSCECKGFGRWGHCKHVDGLAALQRAGRL
jgi:hypothetical protein